MAFRLGSVDFIFFTQLFTKMSKPALEIVNVVVTGQLAGRQVHLGKLLQELAGKAKYNPHMFPGLSFDMDLVPNTSRNARWTQFENGKYIVAGYQDVETALAESNAQARCITGMLQLDDSMFMAIDPAVVNIVCVGKLARQVDIQRTAKALPFDGKDGENSLTIKSDHGSIVLYGKGCVVVTNVKSFEDASAFVQSIHRQLEENGCYTNEPDESLETLISELSLTA